MRNRVLAVLSGLLLIGTQAFAQQRTVSGRVTNDEGAPLAGAHVAVKGTGRAALTNADGRYTIAAASGQVLQFSFVGTASIERTVGPESTIDVQLRTQAISLDAIEVTSLGQTATRKSLGSSQQTVRGPEIAQSMKENWANALQGRVAGLEVVSASGVPGASSQIILRGLSSISGNNQPLLVIDGLPVDNTVQHSNQLFPSLFENRTLDFTNRGADFNPEDIETLTVLKGPEAAALYGIDAANGAIVITTKRGRPGVSGFDYSNNVRIDFPGRTPEIQTVYDRSTQGSSTWLYWGNPYPDTVQRYDNISGFFRNAVTQNHNLAFNGGSADSRLTYRVSARTQKVEGVVPNSAWDKINVSAMTNAFAKDWLRADAVLQYSTDNNNQPFKGVGGPLLGLLAWPADDNAADWTTEEGRRRRITTLTQAAEVDNPYFSVNRNFTESRTNRINVNFGLQLLPVSWGNFKTNIGVDNFTQSIRVVRDPESNFGSALNGAIDESDVVTRNIAVQNLLNFNRQKLTDDIGLTGLLGNSIEDKRTEKNGASGTDFLDPGFLSMNNTRNRNAVAFLVRHRRIGFFGQLQADYKDFLFLTVQGRNDRTSTIPEVRNSFFYPSVLGSFVFTDAFPALGEHMTGKLRASWARTGRDASPYAYAPILESKATSYRGYGYGFTGPNPNLKPELAISNEFGADLGFFDDRLNIDVAVYNKETRDQIVTNVRASYGSGFILINLNGATTSNKGYELTLRGIPLQRRDVSWDAQVNFSHSDSKVLSMPENLPEFYSSDTWIINNIRNGVAAGSPTYGFSGLWYLRNEAGDVLIDPATGLPLRQTNFTPGPYDREPDFLIGIRNRFRFKRVSISALVDIRKGGDVLNGTEWWLTQRGLSTRTLDRWDPRVVQGVLRDGLENTPNPTRNTIVVVPALNNNYYLGMSEELFIEKDINWLRLRDVTVEYQLPRGIIGTRSASVFVTGTELFLLTNYSGMDPIVNGNTAATGGSGGIGIDWGNFPMPVGINFGVRVAF
jgi:TonB-linked SusC/RagA family outer membrane protein